MGSIMVLLYTLRLTQKVILCFLILTHSSCDGHRGGENIIEIETNYIAPKSIIKNSDDEDSRRLGWETFKNCPPGSVVTGYKFTVDQLELSENSIAEIIQGVAFQCSRLGRWNHFLEQKVIFDGKVSTRQPFQNGQNFQKAAATGFSFHRWGSSSSSGKTNFEETDDIVGEWRLKFEGESRSSYLQPPFLSPNNIQIKEDLVECPDSYAICGFSVWRDSALKFIKKFKFSCCYNCIPHVVHLVVYDFTNNGLTDVIHTVSKRIGLRRSENRVGGHTKDNTKKVEPSFGGNIGNGGGFGNQAGYLGGSSSNRRRRQEMVDPGGGQSPSGGGGGGTGGNPAPSPAPSPSGGGGGGGSPENVQPPGGTSSGGSSSSGPLSSSSSDGGSSHFNLRARFEAKFGDSKSSGFSWQDTSYSLWSDEVDEMDTITCKALHRCVMKQLAGECGLYQFNTPSFDLTSIPLRYDPLSKQNGQSPSPPPLSPLKIDRPGEIWIVIQDLTFSKPGGIWNEPKLCPPGSVVTGQQIRFKNKKLPFTGLNFQCCRLNSTDQFEHVMTLFSGSGMGKRWFNSRTPALGSTFVEYRRRGFKWKTNFEMRFQGEESYLHVLGGSAPNFKRNQVTCPPNFAVCGLQLMFDGDGQGQINSAGFKCCYHCSPYEKRVVLESFTNMGYTDTIQTIRRTIGSNVNNEHAQGGSNQTGQVNNVDGINPIGLQAGFASKFDSSNYGGFQWSQTVNSFWTKNEEKTLTIVCKARHLCVYRQLVGVCNEIEIATPYTVKESYPLDNGGRTTVQIVGRNTSRQNGGGETTANFFAGRMAGSNWLFPPLQEKKETGDFNQNFKMNRPPAAGEMWTMAQNLSFAKGSGVWEPALLCPPGSIATAIRVKFMAGFVDVDTAGPKFRVSGLSLQCSSQREDDEGHFQTVNILKSGRGTNDTIWLGSSPTAPILGFSFLEYKMNGAQFKALWQVIFEGHHQPVIVYKNEIPIFDHHHEQSQNVQRRQRVTCAKYFAICGMQTMFDKKGKGILTNLKCKCCYFCSPKEKMVTVDSFANFDQTDTVQNVKWLVGGQKIGELTMSGSRGVPGRKGQMSMNDLTSRLTLVDDHDGFAQENSFGEEKLLIINGAHMQAIFVNYFQNLSSSPPQIFHRNFDWADTSLSLWNSVEEKESKYTCQAHHFCTFKQLVGVCGVFQVSTPLVSKQSFLLPSGNPETITNS